MMVEMVEIPGGAVCEHMNCQEQTDPSHQPFECLQHPKQGYTQFRIPELWDILFNIHDVAAAGHD